MTNATILGLLTLWTLFLNYAHCQQQVFLEEPTNMNAIAGTQAVLKCRIGNQAGKVQWTRNGFALGFLRSIPGFPRYKVVGREEDGVHDLRITNVSLDDDADFQCQVGATSNNRGIRATAHLNVLLPPESVEIENQKNGSKIEVKENGEVQLTCIVKEGKPAAKVSWYRQNVKLDVESEDYRVEDTSIEQRQNAISTITVNPTADDNDVTYSCQAVHEALRFPMKSVVYLSVLYPPGPPEIQGYQEGEVVRMGDTLTLTCISRGGNPLAQVFWYKNNDQVDYSFITRGKQSVNALTFVVGAVDNNAIFRCDASNKETTEPLSAAVKLTVHFSPGKAYIEGPSEASAGDVIMMHCRTERSNPPAEISWVVDGRRLQSNNAVTADPQGGWVTTSNITTTLAGTARNVKTFSCYVSNKALGETIVETKMLSILQPPDHPNIFGYQQGTPIQAGTVQRMTCVAMGGNPLANVEWFKGDKKIDSSNSKTGTISSSEISIIVKEDDNGAEYRCEASNSATKKPLIATIKLNVHFPPSGVSINVWPPILHAGQQAVLTCESGSSNPASAVTWWKDGFMIAGEFNGTIEAPNGGKSTRNKLKLNITSQNDGSMYTCQATNKLLQLSVHDGITLAVKYKPEFYTIPSDKFDILEGESTVINVKARANPSSITYSWSKDGVEIPQLSDVDNYVNKDESRIAAQGSELHISNAERFDAGRYTLKATNDEGSTVNNILLNVQYEANITTVEYDAYSTGENAEFTCYAIGNPMTEGTITWKREGFNMEGRAKTSQTKGRSQLVVYNVSSSDIGEFKCVAFNKIGEPSEMSAYLAIRTKPEIDTGVQYSRAASDEGDTGKLVCRARGAPAMTFKWSKGGVNIVIDSEKYIEETNQVDYYTWESTLFISDVDRKDHGDYLCYVRNEEGFSSTNIKFERTGKPDTPIDIKVLNATHNSVYLTWTPGFDGGLPQRFMIRYKKTKPGSSYMFAAANPENSTQFVVPGLALGTKYEFSVMSSNDKGDSEYTTDLVVAVTSSIAPPGERHNVIPAVIDVKTKIPQIVIISVSVVGAFLFLLNVFLVSCFVYRKRKKRLEEDDSDRSSSKAATVEMYSYANSNNGTVTGETLSSISEKSEQYSDEHSVDDYQEESGKAVSTYLTDGNNTTPYIKNTNYNYKDRDQAMLHSPKISNRSLLSDPDVVPHSQEEDYADALRRNAFNLSMNEKSGYGKTPSTHPPPPPNRTASSGGGAPPEMFYNLTPPADLTYPTYPNGSATMHQSSPHRNPTYVSGEYRPPVLSTFSASSHSPVTLTHPMHPATPTRTVPPELDGHLV